MIPALFLGAAQMGISLYEQRIQAQSNQELEDQLTASIEKMRGTKGGIVAGFDAQNVLAEKEFDIQSNIFSQQSLEKRKTFTEAADFNVGKGDFAFGGTASTKKSQGLEALDLGVTAGQFGLQSELFGEKKNIMGQKVGALSSLDEQIKKLEAQKAGLITEGPGGGSYGLMYATALAGLI